MLVDEQRSRKAFVLVGVAALLLGVLLFTQSAQSEPSVQASFSGEEFARSLLKEDASGVFHPSAEEGAAEEAEGVSVLQTDHVTRQEIPGSFCQEALSLAYAQDIRMNSTQTLIGFMVDEPPEAAYRNLLAELTAKGWLPVESGIEHVATLMKEEGEYRWMLISCIAVGDQTSVMVQVDASSLR